jgi:alpha/beta superfamily hydrolase
LFAVEQVKEAAEYLLSGRRQSAPATRLLLVGYSYGSIVCGSASASIPQVVGVASFAPPIGVRHWLFLFNGNYHLEQARRRTDLPQLLVIGDQDNFTSEESFLEVIKQMNPESATGAVMKGADHFFRGQEKDLMDILGTHSGHARCILREIKG